MKRLTVILFTLLFLSHTGCNLFSGDSFSNGIYVNDDIGFSMGGQNTDYYIEIVLFALENGLVEMDIMFRKPVDEAILSELKGVIGSIRRFE